LSAVIDVNATEKFSQEPPLTGDACLLVIFGASGDLTKRKLIPGLYNLACAGCMNPQFEVLGVGRTPMTSEEFRAKMREAVPQSSDTRNFNESQWKEFEKRLHYFAGDSTDDKFYSGLQAQLGELQKSVKTSNHLFYVSTPASVAGPIVEGLARAGMNRSEGGWARIILEKPFGHDLKTAQELNAILHKVFDEKDVFRIDHYLGKETVQNILVFRFGNSMFEPVWNRNYIDYVEITGAEAVGVEGRASFYEETGALRDMVANHMLQLLALTAMEPPLAFEANEVREQKVQALKSIRPMTPEEVAKRTVRGQYGPGAIAGKPVPGYREEPKVKSTSSTETYVAVEFYVHNWRWAGVPFYVRTGKHLPRQTSEIRIHFKRTPQALFSTTPYEHLGPNVITLRIQPDDGISIAFDVKQLGAHMRALTIDANFSYETAFGSKGPPAYETLLLDSMRGDATLFTRADEVEAEWRIITPIEEAWAQQPPPKFPNYAAGSEGPVEADALIAGDHRAWRRLAK
jgi:glucose-6-phosphate 1-dehydrogenase